MFRRIFACMMVAALVVSATACSSKQTEEEFDLGMESSSSQIEIAESESSAPEIIEPEASEPETTTVSSKNIYDCTDLVFNVEGVGVTLPEALQGATHNVLYMEDHIEVPVMVDVDGINMMVYSIVMSTEALPEKDATTTIDGTFIYVDAYMPEEYSVEAIGFSEKIPGLEASTETDAAAENGASTADDAAADETGAPVAEDTTGTKVDATADAGVAGTDTDTVTGNDATSGVVGNTTANPATDAAQTSSQPLETPATPAE